MTGSENKKLENEALREFVVMLGGNDSTGVKVREVMREELTPRQAQLIRLRYIEELPMAQIADALGISISTVSRTLKRGRCRIRKYLRYNGRYFLRAEE